MKEYKLIGVPIKYGCTIEGADKGIDVLKKYIDFDKIIAIPDFEEPVINNMLNIEKIITVCNNLATEIDNIIKEGYIPITIGGDHSLAIGTIAGSSNNNDISVLWVDTHTDINTHETTISGRIHGMPVACSIGLGPDQLKNCHHNGQKVKPENYFLFGTSDIDPEEFTIIEQNKVNNILYDDIQEKGLDYYLDQIKKSLKNRKVHVSLDLDSMNPNLYKAVSVPNRFDKGFNVKEFLKIVEFIKTLDVVSIDIVEFNPYNDTNNDYLKILLEIIKKLTS